MFDIAAIASRVETPAMPCERDLSLPVALARIQEVVAGFDLKHDLQLLGSQHKTVVARLLGPDNRFVSQGVGKGDLVTGIVGALFEAVEHYCTIDLVDCHNRDVVPLEDLPHTEKFHGERAIELLMNESGTCLGVRRYASLVGKEQIAYPLFLTDPAYLRQHRLAGDDANIACLLRYSSNSGTAIGASVDEALVHALNEVIERDAFSEFLVRQFYAPTGEPLRVVRHETLPGAMKTLLGEAEGEIGAEIYLLDITNGLGIPTYLAITPAEAGGVASHGCGTSLDPGHAIARSITELLQYHHVRTCLPAAAADIAAWDNQLARYPVLRRCLEMDVESRVQAAGIALTAVDGEAAYRWSGRAAEEHKVEITRRIERVGSRPYHAVRHVSPNGVSVVTVVIPGCDRFFLVASGLIVLPSRGLLTNADRRWISA